MKEGETVRVFVVDDFRLVREGLRSLLDDAVGIRVVGDSDSSQGLEQIVKHSPDVVLWTVGVKDQNGPSAAASIRRMSPRTSVLWLATQAVEREAIKARQAGAAGYIYMNCTPERLVDAIRACSPKSDKFLVILNAERGPRDAPPSKPLTRRQIQVLKLAASGRTISQIAMKLDISVRSAERHRANIKQLLGIHDSAGLVRYALRNGLVSEASPQSKS